MICSTCGASEQYADGLLCSNCGCKSGFFEPSGDQKKDALEVIKGFGFKRPILAHEISKACGISSKDLRSLVHKARLRGVPVGSDKRGYYWVRAADEMEPTLEQFYGRIRSLRACVEKLRAIRAELAAGRVPTFPEQDSLL